MGTFEQASAAAGSPDARPRGCTSRCSGLSRSMRRPRWILQISRSWMVNAHTAATPHRRRRRRGWQWRGWLRGPVVLRGYFFGNGGASSWPALSDSCTDPMRMTAGSSRRPPSLEPAATSSVALFSGEAFLHSREGKDQLAASTSAAPSWRCR